MRVMSKAALTCAALTLCLGGAAVFAAGKRRAPLLMTIHFVPPAVCRISFSGQTFDLPDDEDSMVNALRELRRNWRSASISGDRETPYRCIGHAVYLAQRGGFKKVGFVAQPPEN
jgi:hypothetical protein